MATNLTLEKELELLLKILFNLKIYDVTITPTKQVGDFRAKDEDGNSWTSSEFYDFLINEVFVYSYLVGEFEVLCGDRTLEEVFLYDHASSFIENFKYCRNHSKPIGKVILYKQADGNPDKGCLAVVKGADIEILPAVQTISAITEDKVDEFINFAEMRGKKLPIKRI